MWYHLGDNNNFNNNKDKLLFTFNAVIIIHEYIYSTVSLSGSRTGFQNTPCPAVEINF